MDRKKYIVLFFFSWFLISAQDRIELVDGDFTKLKVSSGIIAEVIYGASENKVEIGGFDQDEINIRLRRDELRISLPLNYLFSNSDTEVKIYIQSLESIEATSASELTITGAIHQTKMHFRAVEGATIQALDVKVDELEVFSLTGGAIQLKGKADHQNVTVKTGGEYEAASLKTKTTTVEVSYKGFATVYASEQCDAKVIAGGEIAIHGSPTQFDKETKLGGIIKKVIQK
ncbi:MAG: DUF2807 domain-containing protein [Flavobacteriaceae bacterium]|nr:DUF2807 domain-containing protein [Flavobacteriaceae bacterium]